MTPRMTPAERSTRVKRSRVEIGDGDDVVADEIVVEGAVRAPVARERRRFPHHEAGHMRRLRLGISRRHAVVADLRRGHGDDLPGIGGVGQHLLIAGHARVEHDLALGFTVRTRGDAAEPGTVLESQNGVHVFVYGLRLSQRWAQAPGRNRTRGRSRTGS